MGNRVTLYNLSQAVPSPYLLVDTLEQVPQNLRANLATLKFAEIGGTNNTGIPIPWMLYFGLEDFQLASVQWGDDTSSVLPMPCTSVQQARDRVLKTLPLFERLAGDAQIGKEYWQEAIDTLAKLPFPYLAMDHVDWLCMMANDPEVEFSAFKEAYVTGAPADDFLMVFSDYTDDERPYSHDEWDRLVSEFNFNDVRLLNAIAMGYGHSMYTTLIVNEGVGSESETYEVECNPAV